MTRHVEVSHDCRDTPDTQNAVNVRNAPPEIANSSNLKIIAVLPLAFFVMTIACTMTLLAVSSLGAPPNIIFTIIDDLGHDDVGFRSHEIRTPTIDRLARSGIVLDQYYVDPVCSPSRSTFLTGRYAMHHSVVDWIPGTSAYGLPVNETTLGDTFHAAGYACHAVVSAFGS